MTNNNLPAIKQYLTNPSIKNSIQSRIGEKAGTFITSVLDLYGEDKSLVKCDPNLVVQEGLKAAALDLPINKNLGFAYVIPYGNKPQFQMGYKGYIQLAIRTGQYKHLNAGIVYEGEIMVVDRIRGTLKIEGEATSEKPTGYFCYMELINGFQKAIGWSVEKVMGHGEKFSKSFKFSSSPWKTNTEAMCLKTMILQLVPKYGPMTIEMSTAMASDRGDFKGFDNDVQGEIEQNANTEPIDITPEDEPQEDKPLTEKEKAEIEKEESDAAQQEDDGPGY